MIKKVLISKFIIAISIILLIFSSYVLLYMPNLEGELPILEFILGNFINSYVINTTVIMAYIYLYFKLKLHYDNLEKSYAQFITEQEKKEIQATLKSLRIFFAAICQCFVYRIFMRLMRDVFSSSWNSPDNVLFRTIVIDCFYLSEMIMIIGICISIRKSIETAKRQSMA